MVVERVLFALVANRAIDPVSKLCAEPLGRELFEIGRVVVLDLCEQRRSVWILMARRRAIRMGRNPGDAELLEHGPKIMLEVLESTDEIDVFDGDQ